MQAVNVSERPGNITPYWESVHEEMKVIEKIKTTQRTWESPDVIHIVDNGRRFANGTANPCRKGTISLIGSYKLAAQKLVEGLHDLATESEVKDYYDQRNQIRADMGRQKATKDGVIRFTAPSFGESK